MTLKEVLESIKNGESLAYKSLSGADLSGAEMSGADLFGASLKGASLCRADLRGADLCRADLRGADLRGADLWGSDLSGANLRRANLRGADLRDADLGLADLRGANLKGAKMPSDVKVDGLHRAMYDAVSPAGALGMSKWHTCGTTHCRAGWAIILAGKEGAELEDKYGPAVAGTIIYANSTGMVPDFHCNNADALADIKACAGVK